MLRALEEGNRLTQKPFVMLIDSKSKELEPVMWRAYIDHHHDLLRQEYYGQSSHDWDDHQDLTPPLGNVIICAEHVVWDEHDMALVITILPSEKDGVGLQRLIPPCAVACPHITLGSLRESTNEDMVDDLLRRWRDSDVSRGRIWSIGLSGRFEFDGTMRAVLPSFPPPPLPTPSQCPTPPSLPGDQKQ